MITGFLVGWTNHNGVVALLEGVALLLLFAFAMSWIGVWLGLSVPTVEVAQQVSFTVIFPITFISSAFVPPQTLPEILQPIADWNPTSTLTNSLRMLWGNPNPFIGDTFPSQNPILVTLGWVVVIVAVFGTLGLRRYRNMSR
jgi:ABC-2 type transport system permease protein